MVAAALSQAWPPFVLVGALLVIGAVAHREGLFGRLGLMLEAVPGPTPVLFAAACLLLAVTTALLNLDTAVAFAMPVVVLAARERQVAVRPFVYASLFMVNASSLYLPGSNLTNLLVLHSQPLGGGYAARMLAPGLLGTGVTAVGLAAVTRRELAQSGRGRAARRRHRARRRLAGPGVPGALAAAVAMVSFANPALPVAGVAVLVGGVSVARSRVTLGELFAAVSPRVLAAIFAVAVGLGVLARAWGGPAHLLSHATGAETAGIAALATVLVNNLPAAVLLSAHAVPHPQALLIGLDLGPNLAVTGSLAAFLWIRTAQQLNVEASIRTVSVFGIVLAPLAIAAALPAST